MSLMIQSWCAGTACDPCKPKPPPLDCMPSWPTGSWVYFTGGATETFNINITHPLCSSPHCVYGFSEWSNPFGSYPTGVGFGWPRWVGGLPGGPPQSDTIQVLVTIEPGGFSQGAGITGRPFSDTDNTYHAFLSLSSFIIPAIPSQIIATAQWSGAREIRLDGAGLGGVTVYS